MLFFLNRTFAGPKTIFHKMVPSGNKDYIIIIIILWGIKDLSQPVSVALKNTSKSQHSVTKSIVDPGNI